MIQIQLCVAADALLSYCCCASQLIPLLQTHSLTVCQKEQLLQCCHAPLLIAAGGAAASCGGLLLQQQLQGPLQSM
jgi:hypothetical protein